MVQEVKCMRIDAQEHGSITTSVEYKDSSVVDITTTARPAEQTALEIAFHGAGAYGVPIAFTDHEHLAKVLEIRRLKAQKST